MTGQWWVRKNVDPDQPILHTSRDGDCFGEDTKARLATADEIARGRPCHWCDPWHSPLDRSRSARGAGDGMTGLERFARRRAES
jgi:hypothetical protein